MGIVNLTDNSYFAESRCLGTDGNPDIDKITERIGRMIAEGATIIDIGACSTRPGSEPVGEAEEWRRISAVLPHIRKAFPDVTVSIDTYWSSVVRKAFDLIGNFIVNDISAGEDDPQMLSTAGSLGLTYIAMHKRGTPATMQNLCDYRDVSSEVLEYFRDFVVRSGENYKVGSVEKGSGALIAGMIEKAHLPGGAGIRLDTAIYPGYSIPPYYDSMIVKIIAYDKDRISAIRKMIGALSELRIKGVTTNSEFLYDVLNHPDFQSGMFSTDFIDRHYEL